MPAKKKTWTDKLNEPKKSQVKLIDKDFADIPAGSRMFIATPSIIEEYIKQIEPGNRVDLKTLRKDLAIEHKADSTCPVTTGIFLRIVAEANYEKLQAGDKLEKLAPFWRAIDPKSPLAKKLSFGSEFLDEQISKEKQQK